MNNLNPNINERSCCRKYPEITDNLPIQNSSKRRRYNPEGMRADDVRIDIDAAMDIDGTGYATLLGDNIQPAFSHSAKHVKPQDQGLNALFLCDIECKDGNGAGLQTVRDALKMGIPFFCSKAMLHGTFIKPNSSDCSNYLALQTAAAEIFHHLKMTPHAWDVWEEKTNRELLFLVPRSACGGASPTEKLKAFGLDENKLTQIRPEMAFEGHCAPLTLDSFLSVFESDPEAKVRLALTAHSSTEHAGGMTKSDFVKFLTFFNEKRKCSGLFVTSCFSGGPNKLCHSDLDLNYPVIIRSIGDFVTYYTGTQSTSQFFFDPQKVLSQPVEETARAYERMLSKDSIGTHWQNIPQIKLPGQRKFVPLQYDRSSYLVKNSKTENKRPLVIWAAKMIQLFSRHISQTLNIKSVNPLLLSMKPAHSTHVIDRIEHNGTLTTLFQNTINTFNQNHKGTSRQVLFIKELKTKDTSLKNVLLSCAPGEVKLLAYDQKNDIYVEYSSLDKFEIDKVTPHTISKDQFSLFVYQWTKQHIASTHKKNFDILDHIVESLKESKGGMSEHLKLFLDCEANSTIPISMVPKIRRIAKTYDEEILFLMWVALANHQNELFEKLLEGAKWDVNQPVFEGMTLMHFAVQAQNPEAVEMLLEHGAEINRQELQEQQTPLHMCVKLPISYKRDEVLRLLLEAEDLDIVAEDKHGKAPLYYVSNKYDAELLIIAGANLEPSYRSSPLIKCILSKNASLMEYYLKSGFLERSSDAHLYLSDAVQLGNLKIIELLLEYGADPTKVNATHYSAFDYCALYGTPKILELLAKKANESISRMLIHERLVMAGMVATRVSNSAMSGKSLLLSLNMGEGIKRDRC